jgi:hypothetical protein
MRKTDSFKGTVAIHREHNRDIYIVSIMKKILLKAANVSLRGRFLSGSDYEEAEKSTHFSAAHLPNSDSDDYKYRWTVVFVLCASTFLILSTVTYLFATAVIWRPQSSNKPDDVSIDQSDTGGSDSSEHTIDQNTEEIPNKDGMKACLGISASFQQTIENRNHLAFGPSSLWRETMRRHSDPPFSEVLADGISDVSSIYSALSDIIQEEKQPQICEDNRELSNNCRDRQRLDI